MPELAVGIIGFVFIAVTGFMMRMLWAGLRDSIIRAVLDSSLKKLLGGLEDGVRGISADIRLMRSDHLLTSTRLDAHLTHAAVRDEEFLTFKYKVQDWMKKIESVLGLDNSG